MNSTPSLWLPYALLFSGMLGLISCQQRLSYPIAPESTATASGKVGIVWRDLVTSDLKAAQAFYGEVFGWSFERMSNGGYLQASLNGRPVAGFLPLPKEADPSSSAEWLVAVKVPDVTRAARELEARGGTIVMDPREMEGRGPAAIVADPQGALFSLLARGEPAGSDPPLNGWLWTELWSNDLDASVNVYAELTGLDPRQAMDDDRKYYYFQMGDDKLVGMITNPMENTRTHWVPYIRVADPAATAAAVKAAGGTVLAGPDPELRNGTVVIAMDPTGAHFVAQQWSR